MPRLRALLAALGLCVLAPAYARASETVRLRTGFDPDRLGASTTISYGFQISAPNGLPPAVTSIDLRLPAGIGLATSTLGLATCEAAVVLAGGPRACPQNAAVGFGSALVQVPFQGRLIRETAGVAALFGPPQNEHPVVLFYVDGLTPIYAQFVFAGELLPDSGAFGQRLDTGIPLIPALPEGPDVEVIRFQTTIGPRHLTYYRRARDRTVAFQPRGMSIPLTCPRGGFPFAAEFDFADGSHAAATSVVPCPRDGAGGDER